MSSKERIGDAAPSVVGYRHLIIGTRVFGLRAAH